METLLYTQDNLDNIAKNLLLRAGESDNQSSATIVALAGNLGAGKTTLIQQLAHEMGVVETITSPTFVVMKRYKTAHPVFLELIHIDAYRIEETEEMIVLGFLEWIKNPQVLVCIEWPEKIAALIPAEAISVTLEVVDDKTRKIIYG